MACFIGTLITKLHTTMMIMDTVGTITNGPVITPITAKNSNTKGRSTSADKVAEVTNYRTDSKSDKFLAKEPVD